jgi:hypothetical protein
MTLSTAGYTVGANLPLNHARILWAPISGVVTADGTGGALAANDFTFQRWDTGALPANWTLVAAANVDVDTVFIAGHNLGTVGATVEVQTAATLGGAFTTRATIVPPDDTAIAVMINNAGTPYSIRELRIRVTGPAPAQIGIIRAGVALQMQQPVFGGVNPIGLNRLVETRHAISETGQWLGRTVQRQALRTTMDWAHLESAWYRANFDPFAQRLPQRPFGLIQNPLRMPESVAWCWTDESPAPQNMGVRDLMSVSLNITGFLE